MKPENTETRILEYEVELDGKVIKRIKFDLKHINYGWDEKNRDYMPKSRSNYSGDDVEEFFSQFEFLKINWDDNKTIISILGVLHHRYVSGVYDTQTDENLRIIIDVPVKFKNEAVVVTIYSVGK